MGWKSQDGRNRKRFNPASASARSRFARSSVSSAIDSAAFARSTAASALFMSASRLFSSASCRFAAAASSRARWRSAALLPGFAGATFSESPLWRA
jgi:hypothetical protein